MKHLVFGILVTVALSLRAAPPKQSVRGSVTDEAANPLPKALVEIRCKSKGEVRVAAKTTTEEGGRFVVEWDGSGTCALRIELAGFRPAELPVSSGGSGGSLDVGTVRLKIGCSGPGVICDSVTPKK